MAPTDDPGSILPALNVGPARADAPRRRIAVIGSGISGLSCAWLLAPHHDVTVYESAPRAGGHSNTVSVDDDGREVPVDTGFIVYNERTYPNLTALFAHLGVETAATDMSLAVSRGHGADLLEYSGSDLGGLLAQKRNLLRLRFWRMLAGTLRFYREAPRALSGPIDDSVSLGAYLDSRGFGRGMQQDHLLPMAAAIWSCGADAVRDQPALAFIRFCNNHGLLQVTDRPVWRSVTGGSRTYVARMVASIQQDGGHVRLSEPVHAVRTDMDGVVVRSETGESRFDDVAIASHAPDALAMLHAPSPELRDVLGGFRTIENYAVLHEDDRLMPRHRRAWSSWNVRDSATGGPCVTYWMNRLQTLDTRRQMFVTLNPPSSPSGILREMRYRHPAFDAAALRAQRRIGALQGVDRLWFCGAYLGSGFHEDGLQAGLAVAEALGGVRRPWQVENESGRLPWSGPLAASRPE